MQVILCDGGCGWFSATVKHHRPTVASQTREAEYSTMKPIEFSMILIFQNPAAVAILQPRVTNTLHLRQLCRSKSELLWTLILTLRVWGAHGTNQQRFPSPRPSLTGGLKLSASKRKFPQYRYIPKRWAKSSQGIIREAANSTAETSGYITGLLLRLLIFVANTPSSDIE